MPRPWWRDRQILERRRDHEIRERRDLLDLTDELARGRRVAIVGEIHDLASTADTVRGVAAGTTMQAATGGEALAMLTDAALIRVDVQLRAWLRDGCVGALKVAA